MLQWLLANNCCGNIPKDNDLTGGALTTEQTKTGIVLRRYILHFILHSLYIIYHGMLGTFFSISKHVQIHSHGAIFFFLFY